MNTFYWIITYIAITLLCVMFIVILIAIFQWTKRENNMMKTTGFNKLHECYKCKKLKPTVIKINERLICVKCRYDQIGKDAFKEPLYFK